MEEPFDDGEPHDLQVEAHRPVLDVVEVVLDSLLERRVAAPAVHLRPARQPAFTLWRSMYCGMRCLNCATKCGRSGRGPTIDMSPRSTFQSCGSSSRFDRGGSGRARDARIVLLRPDRSRLPLGIVLHRAELEDREGLAVESHPLLLIEHRPARRQPHEQGDDPERERQHQERRG